VPNVAPVPFDWDDRSTYRPALDGAAALYFVPPSFRTDYPPAVDAFLEAATAGVADSVRDAWLT
jgi:hypothetical protein